MKNEYQLICTSYNKKPKGLVLRNNWIEGAIGDDDLSSVINTWKLPNNFVYPHKQSVSNILEGVMEDGETVIHVRIIRFA